LAFSRNSKTACSAEQAVFIGCGGGILTTRPSGYDDSAINLSSERY